MTTYEVIARCGDLICSHVDGADQFDTELFPNEPNMEALAYMALLLDEVGKSWNVDILDVISTARKRSEAE